MNVPQDSPFPAASDPVDGQDRGAWSQRGEPWRRQALQRVQGNERHLFDCRVAREPAAHDGPREGYCRLTAHIIDRAIVRERARLAIAPVENSGGCKAAEQGAAGQRRREVLKVGPGRDIRVGRGAGGEDALNGNVDSLWGEQEPRLVRDRLRSHAQHIRGDRVGGW